MASEPPPPAAAAAVGPAPPTAAAAAAAAPAVAAAAGGENTALAGVDGAATPIELLAEATQLAREALAQNASSSQAPRPPSHTTIHSQPHSQPQPQTTATAAAATTPPPQTAADAPANTITTPAAATTTAATTATVTSTAGTAPTAATADSTTSRQVPPLAIPARGDPPAASDNLATPVDSPPDEMLISPAAAVHPNVGSKRTASGAIKAPSTSSSSTSLPATPYQHATQLPPSSASPRAGRERIGELSTQLRSRLSYAMIKMQNGLQGQSFDQVETFIAEKRQNRLSQSPSIAPAASTTAVPPVLGSPATSQALKRQTSADSYSGGLGISLIPASSAPPVSPRVAQNRLGRHARTTSDPSAMYLAPAANIASQHDPNYWVKPPPSPRPSNVRGTPQGSSSQPAQDSFASRFQSSPRHLAPAAPIRPHAGVTSRHHHTLPARRGKLPPPSLPKTFSNMSNMSSVSNVSNAPTDVLSLVDEPITSSQTSTAAAVRPCTPVRTNTLTMEQDAVESLMFLSSPGHSQHRGSRPASRSAMSTHQPQFQSQLIQQVWNGAAPHAPTDHEGDSFMGETAASTVVDDDEEVRLVEEDDELDRELDRQRKNQEYAAPDTEVNGVVSPAGAVDGSSSGGGKTVQREGARVKRVKTMEEVLSAAERADAAAHWGYAKGGGGDKASAAPVAPSPMLSG
ncbi:hypothetical protein TWF696_006898 [Orbilia brochopaga]|uniref:Uncharacterized protein n=1 Tax=Orbilia brochopaga TaxID=3140254 RepID=A0AAV9UR00_9PEZI